MSKADLFVAVSFAIKAHGNQKRKYTGDPYVLHPVEVAKTLERYGFRQEVVIAGVLHDVVEDTEVTEQEIRDTFGDCVADLVMMVTDVSTLADGNRAVRKSLDKDHLAKASEEGMAIKLADILSNTKDIVSLDTSFAKMYLLEMERVLPVLHHADMDLWEAVHTQITNAMIKLGLPLV